MARSWLAIALRVHGAKMHLPERAASPPDLQAVALEALASDEGNYRFFRIEEQA
jgi:hypothetical protein